ncbi:SRPBCC domain-containing protein [Parasediminibacterium sp. JCM 36343]|uniref:SRPBCC domain-containing protein n=1 Tax=Parasediminibacterium sp. JCM 36343 TaxID=3374279 RepID=UPI0039797408
MENKNYAATILVSQPASKVFDAIKSVSKWWSENIEGNSEKLNDVFKVIFGNDSFVTHQLVEVIANKKVVWLVTDCYLPWLTDKHEWTNTKISFDLTTEGNSTQITFNHIGLVPAIECYDMCVKGWDQYIKGSLFKLITEGHGEPQKKK